MRSGRGVVETQLVTWEPKTGPNGESNRPPPPWLLRLRSGSVQGTAQPRPRVKQRLLRVETLTGAGERQSYVQLLGYSVFTFAVSPFHHLLHNSSSLHPLANPQPQGTAHPTLATSSTGVGSPFSPASPLCPPISSTRASLASPSTCRTLVYLD
jgi:hypothetical protein